MDKYSKMIRSNNNIQNLPYFPTEHPQNFIIYIWSRARFLAGLTLFLEKFSLETFDEKWLITRAKIRNSALKHLLIFEKTISTDR